MRRNLLGEEIAAPQSVSREILGDALHRALKNLSLLEFSRLFTNESDSAIEFARLCAGDDNVGQKISLCFNPHRLATQALGRPSVYGSLQKPAFCSGLARALIFEQFPKDYIYRVMQLGVNSAQYINEFPPHLARNLIQRYCKASKPHVLDPCAGWGGRMIGAASVGAEYVAWEPAPETYKGLLQLGQWLLQFKTGFKFHVHNYPYEDAQIDGLFDIALTSPPYYDTEVYSESETDSAHRYRTFRDWVEGFFHPLILHTMERLNPKACFLLNLGDRRYPLSTEMKKIWPHWERLSRSGLSGKGGLHPAEGAETVYCLRHHA